MNEAVRTAIREDRFAFWRARLGTLGFGGAGLGNLYASVREPEAEAAIAQALESGIRYFDTAPYYGYGLSEERLGRGLASCDIVISTKVGRIIEAGESPSAEGFAVANGLRARFDYSRDGILRSFEASLQRLGRERVDILLLHDVGSVTHGDRHPAILRQALDEALPAMTELKSAGLCDAIGLGVNEQAVCLDILPQFPLDLILLAGRYTLIEQAGAGSLLSLAMRYGTGIIAGGPYNSGLLARAEKPGDHYDYAPPSDAIGQRAAQVYAIAARHGVDVGAAALAFPAAHPAVVNTLVGLRNASEVKMAVRRIAAPIPAAFWSELVASGLLEPGACLP